MYIVENINWLFEGMFSTKGSHILLLLHYISDIDSIRSVDIFICKRLRSTAKPAHSMLRQDFNKKSKARELKFLKI